MSAAERNEHHIVCTQQLLDRHTVPLVFERCVNEHHPHNRQQYTDNRILDPRSLKESEGDDQHRCYDLQEGQASNASSTVFRVGCDIQTGSTNREGHNRKH